MSYSTGQTIAAADYNTFVTGTSTGTYTTATPNVGVVWGTGNGRYGYGQPVTGIAPVAVSSTVTATQWTGLVQVTSAAAGHENVAISPIPGSMTAGSTIAANVNISTDVTTVFNSVGTAYSLSAGTANNTQFTGAWGGSGNRRLVFTQVVNFASGDAARYFFNAGGLINLTFSRSGGSSTTRNTDWTNLCANCGAIQFGYRNTVKSGGGGATPSIILNTNNGGYWNQTYNTVKTNFKQFDNASPYTTDYIQVDVTTSGTQGSNGDLGPTVTFTTYWVNTYSNSFQQTVDGTATTALTIYTPGNAYFTTSNPWGTVTFNSGASGVVSN